MRLKGYLMSHRRNEYCVLGLLINKKSSSKDARKTKGDSQAKDRKQCHNFIVRGTKGTSETTIQKAMKR